MTTRSESARRPYGVEVDEFARYLDPSFTADSDLTWEALRSLTRVFQALASLNIADERPYAYLRTLWQLVLRLRSQQPANELDESVLNRYGELSSSFNRSRLTKRECDVLSLVVLGWPDRRIAEELVISPATVKGHLRNIYKKLGVHNRISAAVMAFRCGFLIKEQEFADKTKRNWRRVTRTRRETYGK